MNPLDRIAEERLEEAIREGVFDDLPGHGKPLELEDLSKVPDDLRAGYMLLKGSGYLPIEMELKKEILTLDDLLRSCRDQEEITRLRKKRSLLALRFAMLMEKRGSSAASEYIDEIHSKLDAEGAPEKNA